MKNIRHFISLLSVFVLTFLSFPISIFAQETSNPNVALNAEVIAGENAEKEFPYENIVDGNLDNDSRLSSNVDTKPSVTLKLDKVESIQYFRLYFEERNIDVLNNIKTYQITFADNKDFTDSYSVERTVDDETLRDDVLLAQPLNAQYIKIEVLETHGSSWDNAGLVEFELYKEPTNYALDATAKGENAENNENTPDKAIDGNLDTRFASAENTTPTLEVDLGVEKDIQFFRLLTEERSIAPTNNLKEYTVTFANDEDFSSEILKETFTMGDGQTLDEVVLEEVVKARYVKISDIKSYGGSWDNISIREFELYGHPFDTVEPEGGAESIENIRPVYDAKSNKIIVEPEVQGYTVENNGADFEQIVDADFNVHQPLTEKTVNISLKITDDQTGKTTTTKDYPVVIPGLYEENIGNEKPAVSPELAEWYSDREEEFVLTEDSKIVVDGSQQKELKRAAEELQADYLDISGKTLEIVSGSAPEKGDIFLTLTTDDTFLGEEGYAIEITDKVVVSALDKTGAYWSTRTILQILVQDEQYTHLPVGQMRDYPKYEVRGFLLDVARKPFSMEILEDFAKNMAWYKMNDLQIHLSDNYIFLEDYGHGENELEALKAYDAFRLESDYVNDQGQSATAKDYAYSKEEFNDFILDNRELGVQIVPEIDIPAHANSFTKTFPEMMVTNQVSPLNNKRPLVDHIDISKPAVVDMVKELFADYTTGANPTFDEETIVHIGADEFLSDYTAYRDFINDFVPHLKETNDVRMWGGLSWIKDDPLTEIKKEAIEDVQMNLWSSAWADGIEMYDMGFQLINTIDSYLYMVPNGSGNRGGYGDYLNLQTVFNNFEPNLLARKSGGWDYVPAGSDQMLGGVFALWNDNIDKRSNGLTEADLFKRFYDALPVLAEKTWANGDEKGSLKAVQETSANVGMAPRSNPLAQMESEGDTHVEYKFDQGKELVDASANKQDLSEPVNATFETGKNSKALTLTGKESYIESPLTVIGEGSQLSFDLKLDEVNPGEILFEYDSPYGTHDIRVTEDGKLGFTRELHDYEFAYDLPQDKWVNITLKTESQKTSLYVNDEFVGQAKGKFVHNEMVKKTDIPHSTFALPIQRIGSKTNAIKGQIDNVVLSEALPDDAGKIPSELITVKATSEYAGDDVENVIDGDVGTIWHSDWSNPETTLPQELTFTFNEPIEIERMSYLARQDATHNGSVKAFDLYITDKDGKETKVIENGTFEKDKFIKMIHFDSVETKEVRFVIVESYGDTENKFASAAEIAFFPPKEESVLDKKELANTIEEAETKVEKDYTKDSWATFAEALTQAKQIFANEETTQAEIDQAVEVLKNAMTGLKESEEVVIESVKDLKKEAEAFVEAGAFETEAAARVVITHLTALENYEKQGNTAKVIKHLEGLIDLLTHQFNSGLITEEAYEQLVKSANQLLEKIKESEEVVIESVKDLKKEAEAFVEAGAFKTEAAARAVITHLTALENYEKQGNTAKVIKHLKGLIDLLTHQFNSALITEEAYEQLIKSANQLLEQLK